MNYADERWLKVYTRDTGGWTMLSWQARGLALEIARKLDASGSLPLGKRGLPALAGILRGRWEDMAPYVEELLADDRLVLLDGNVLHDPEHQARQEARATPAARKKAQRERESLSRDVTRRHATSRDVTPRREEKRSEEIRIPPVTTSPSPPSGGPDPSEPITAVRVKRGTRLPDGWTPSDETQAWARAQGVADPLAGLDEFRDFWRSVPGARGVKLDWDATYRNRLRQIGQRPAGRGAKGSEITKQPYDPAAPWLQLPEVG